MPITGTAPAYGEEGPNTCADLYFAVLHGIHEENTLWHGASLAKVKRTDPDHSTSIMSLARVKVFAFHTCTFPGT